MNNNKTGSEGEKIAHYFLRMQGYHILEQNWRFNKAEVDVICKKEDTIIFVEVKTRKGKQFGHPEQAVTKAKQNHLARAAKEYIYKAKHEGEIRYDIISISMKKGEEPEILHLEDAFFPIS